jgi:hypothetical protein
MVSFHVLSKDVGRWAIVYKLVHKLNFENVFKIEGKKNLSFFFIKKDTPCRHCMGHCELLEL